LPDPGLGPGEATDVKAVQLHHVLGIGRRDVRLFARHPLDQLLLAELSADSSRISSPTDRISGDMLPKDAAARSQKIGTRSPARKRAEVHAREERLRQCCST
jgi:hypothetical protein